MTIFTKICSGLFISALSLGAYAAEQGETPTPAPAPGSEQAEVHVNNPTEVIQVLYIGTRAEQKLASLILEKSTDEALKQFANELTQDGRTNDQSLQKLALNKNVSLEAGAMTAPAQTVQARLVTELEALTTKPAAEFQAAVLSSIIAEHQKLIDLYSRIEQQSDDALLKTAVTALRPVAEKHLATAQKLQLTGSDAASSESF